MLSADEGIGDIPAMISTTDEGIDEIQQCYLVSTTDEGIDDIPP